MARDMGEVLLQAMGFVQRAQPILEELKLPGDAPKVRFHDERLFPIVIFKVDTILLQRPYVLELEPPVLRVRMAEAMASCAMSREFLICQAQFKQSVDIRRSRRPVLKPYKSAYWQMVFNRLIEP